MLESVIYVACLLNVAHGFSYGEQFLNDLLNSQHADHCDFGYVSDHNNQKITNQIVATLNER